jgi:26S proteasome regulatory subunit N6
MILDRTISGILDQGKGHLILYDQTIEDKSYSKGVEIIQNMTGAVDALTARAKKFSTKSLKGNEEKSSNKLEKKE